MHHEDLQHLYGWFSQYAAGFTAENPLVMTNLELKTGHTARVAEYCRAIAESLALSPEACLLAEAAGVLHDVGRFPQMLRYGTFSDSRSCNHAEMSLQVIEANGLWQSFTPAERDIVYAAIEHHNKLAIPDTCTGDALVQAKILRDADKLDGFAMAASGESQRYTVTLNANGDGEAFVAKDILTVTPVVYEAILAHRCLRFAELRTGYDRILFVIAMMYDLYYRHTFALVRERRYVEQIFTRLPDGDIFREMQQAVLEYIDGRLAGD